MRIRYPSNINQLTPTQILNIQTAPNTHKAPLSTLSTKFSGYSGLSDEQEQAFRSNSPSAIRKAIKPSFLRTDCPTNALHLLIELTDPSIESIKVLLRQAVFLNTHDESRQNRLPLHCYAAKSNIDPKVLRFLVFNTPNTLAGNYKFERRGLDDNGQEPFHVLLSNPKVNITVDLVKPFYLISKDPQGQKDKNGKNPLQIYMKRLDPKPEVVSYMVRSAKNKMQLEELKKTAIEEYQKNHKILSEHDKLTYQTTLKSLENIETKYGFCDALNRRFELFFAQLYRFYCGFINLFRFQQKSNPSGG